MAQIDIDNLDSLREITRSLNGINSRMEYMCRMMMLKESYDIGIITKEQYKESLSEMTDFMVNLTKGEADHLLRRLDYVEREYRNE